MVKLQKLCLLSFILLFISTKAFNEMMITGFIEFGQEGQLDDSIDVSKLEVILMNEKHQIIDRTYSSQNGLFLIPIYDPRQYYLRVVNQENSGVFEPEEIVINLEGKSEEEIQEISEQAFNFRFAGFYIKETVLSLGSSTGGPNGVKLAIYDEQDNEIAQTVTEDQGVFTFNKLMIGNYIIKPVGESQKSFSFVEDSVLTCKTRWSEEQQCTGSIIVSGFEIEGQIKYDNQPVPNLHVFLYPEQETKNHQCQQKILQDHPLKGTKPYLCYTVTNDQGQYSFNKVPHGNYKVYIRSFDKNKQMVVQPDYVDVFINHSSFSSETNLEITKFSISGLVVDQQKNPIKDIDITLDGQTITKSDQNGFYQLKDIQPGSYTLEANHQHIFFEPIHNLKITIWLNNLPDLVLSQLDICGNIKFNIQNQKQASFSYSDIRVFLQSKTEKRSTVPNGEGRYCFATKPDNYDIYTQFQKSSLNLQPKQHVVKLVNEPIFDLDFYRPTVSVKGKILFKGNSSQQDMKETKIYLKSKKQKTLVQNWKKGGQFDFRNILEGSYEVSVDNPKFCWETQSYTFQVTKAKNITDVVFKQIQYGALYSINQELTFNVEGESTVLTLKPNEKSICLKNKGQITLIPNDCYKFNRKITLNTANKQPVVIKPSAYLVQGQLELNLDDVVKKQSENMVDWVTKMYYLTYTSQKGQKVEAEKRITISHVKTTTDKILFSYQFYAEENTVNKVQFKAKDFKQSASIFKQLSQAQLKSLRNVGENLQFQPAQQTVRVKNNCVRDVSNTNFKIQVGYFIKGEFSIPLDNVNVKLFSVSKTRQGSQKLTFIKELTNVNQEFQYGPFTQQENFKVVPELDGYKFQQEKVVEDNILHIKFVARKLSTLQIDIVDQYDVPIPGVLIFLSSTSRKHQFKMQNYTDENGIFKINEIIKGEYIVRAVLKEYVFTPSQTHITVKEGESESFTFVGEQVAFSIYGKGIYSTGFLSLLVQNLDGREISKVTIDATPDHEKNNFEDIKSLPTEMAVTDENGNFRIRGLNPNLYYNLQVRNSDNIKYIRPETYQVFMQEEDQYEIQFIGFEKDKSYQLSGRVLFSDQLSKEEVNDIKNIQLDLVNADNGNVVATEFVGMFRYYSFQDIQPGSYKMKVKYELLPQHWVQQQDLSVILSPEEINWQHRKNVKVYTQGGENEEKFDGNILFGPLLLCGLLFAVVNDKSNQYLRSLLGMFGGSQPTNVKRKRTKSTGK